VAEPELELKGGRGVCFACHGGFSSFYDFFVFNPKQGGVGPPLDPPLHKVRVPDKDVKSGKD